MFCCCCCFFFFRIYSLASEDVVSQLELLLQGGLDLPAELINLLHDLTALLSLLYLIIPLSLKSTSVLIYLFIIIFFAMILLRNHLP